MSAPTKYEAGEFAVRRMDFSVNPWRIIHEPSGRSVSIPHCVRNGDGEDIRYRGAVAFPRKRDALVWMRDELPALLTQLNP